MSIALSRFARKRLFPTNRLDKIQGVSADEFEQYINQNEPQESLDGYAPFCKLLVYPNWTDTRVMAVAISDENRHLLRSRYEARTKKELPVLARWFEGIEPPKAGYLLVIVYSKEQMHIEGDMIDADWGVVGVLPTEDAKETPLAPITIMRNSLGVDEGGSGVPIDRKAYRDAAEFWNNHATWRTSTD
jgi:hypothetical protein